MNDSVNDSVNDSGNRGAVAVATGAEVAELTAALNRLLPQLSSSAAPLDEAAVAELVDHPACTVLTGRLGDELVGAMVLVTFPLPTGVRAWIEDVVVDEAARGRGVGAALNRRAIEIATDAGARTVDLTSRPSREAANRLYRRLGFVARDTNVYRLELDR